MEFKTSTDPSTVRACYANDGLGWTGSDDTFTNALGHLTASWGVEHDGTVVAASEFYQFDAMGRVQEGRQCTPATCGATNYPVQTGYGLMGHQINLWESSVARYSPYDTAARLSGLSASLNVSPPALNATGPGTQPLLNISAHSPFGGLATATLGNSLTESRTYTNRGWLWSMVVGPVYSLGVGYDYDGNVTNTSDSENGNWSYSLYDGVNRLRTATNTTTGQTLNYSFDPWGNMTCAGSLPCTPQGLAFNNNPQNNRITTAGYSYDAAGNLSTDNTHGYSYDAENRLTCVWRTDGTCTSASATLYLYDADGRRVGKQQANTLEDYAYDPKGNVSSVHDGTGNLLRTEFYPPDGRHVATLNGNTWNTSYLFWNHADWLGTERVRTNSGGTAVEWCSDTPYGMNLTCSPPPDQSPMHFTGKQRDYESNLDYFGARFNESAIGRFMTPDPDNAGGHENDPQSWNGYAYARNNPSTLTDPTGLVTEVCEQGANGENTNCAQLENATFRQFKSENSELYFANGNIYANGNLVGTYNELSSDEDEKAQTLASAVSANHPGDLIAGLAGLSIAAGTGVGAGLYAIVTGAGLTTLPLVAQAGGTAAGPVGYELLKASYANQELVDEALSGNVPQRLMYAGQEIRDVGRLVAQYGGNASDWVKLSTRGVDPSKIQAYAQGALNKGAPIEVHYYKNMVTGLVVELKSVFTGVQ